MRRAAICLLLTALGLLGGAAPAGAGQPVDQATLEVRQLQTQVARAATRLTAATRQLEARRSALDELRRQRDDAEQRAEQASTAADAAAERLSRVVAAAYRSPVPDSFVLVVSGPDAFRAVTTAQSDLQRARSSTADLVRAADEARDRAESAAARAQELERAASAQADELARDVAALQAESERTGEQLRAAWTRLDAARLAADTSCVGEPTAAANGFLPRSALCPLPGTLGHRLRPDAAADFARLQAASVAERGEGLCVTDSYRSYGAQVDVFARKPRLAAVPGTSRHGLGTALDLGCGVESFGTAAHRWMQVNGPRFGWVHPAWAGPRGSMPEPWHWEHAG